MSLREYNERFYHLVRRESFYAKRLSAMNESFGQAFLNLSKFIINEGYVSNAREVDNIIEALPEQALTNMFSMLGIASGNSNFSTSFKIALKAVNPRLHENAHSGEKRQAAAIAMRLAEYSKNNATYLKPDSKAPEKDAEGAAGEFNPKGSEKKPKGGSGAVNAALKGKVSQTEEVEQVDEINYAGVRRINKEYHRKKEADEMAARAKTHKDKMKNDPEYAAKRKKANEVIARMGKGNPMVNKEEVEQVDEIAPAVAMAGKIALGAAKAVAANQMKKKAEQQSTTEAVDPDDAERMSTFQKLQKNVDQKKKAKKGVELNIRGNDSEEQKKRLEKKRGMKLDDHPQFKKEEVEQVEEEGKKDACYHKVKSRYSVWPSAYASGALVKCRKVGAANWGNSSKKEGFDIDHLLDDPTFDLISEEELLEFAFDIFEEMEQEGILTEAVEYFDDFLIEDYYDSAVAKSKANARSIRKQKIVGAMKKAGSAIKSAGSAAAGRAKEMAKKAAPAIKKGAETAGRAVKAAAKGGASIAKKVAVKSAGAAGEMAGAAVGGYQKGKANASAGSSPKPSTPSSSSSSGDKVDDAIRSVQRSGGSSSGGSSDSGTATRKRGLLRRVGSAIKSGLKKAVGKTARGVSNVSGGVAKRMGEETKFDIVLDYLLENEVCTLDDAEDYMLNLTEDQVEEILGKVE